MKKLLFNICCLLYTMVAAAQLPVGSWSDHLRYNTANCLAVGSKEVFASTGASVLVFNKEFSELKKLSPVNGLSETGISTIAWSEENDILVIAYKDTNLDLVSKNTVYNIPDILNKYIPGNKTVNRIRTSGRYAYLAASFGIVIVDLIKMEIHDTWRPGPDSENNEVFDIAFGNGLVYAATGLGVWYGDINNQGLAYFGNWKRIDDLPDPGSRCTLAIFAGNALYVNVRQAAPEGDIVYSIGDAVRLHSFIPRVINTSFDHATGGFTISSPFSVRYYTREGTLQQTVPSYGWGTPDISQGIIENNDIWIADINYGLVRGRNMNEFASLTLDGPASDHAASITSMNGNVIICAGGADNSWNKKNMPFQVSAFTDNHFINLYLPNVTDAMRSCIDPAGSSHFFVSTWGDGLMEYNNNVLVKKYDNTNSPLQADGTLVKVSGLAMDNERNLWITQTGVTDGVKILKADGTWIVHPAAIDAPLKGDIISTRSGQKWIILPGGYGVFVISGDKSKKLTVRDSDGSILNSVFSIAEDLEGNIWLGTDHGPVVYYNTERVFEEDFQGYRIKVPRNDGSGLADYLLGTETITSISVDGADRKWLGTAGSGAYLVSRDGVGMLRNYNEKNSPLFSDSIATINVDNKSGEVWFGTSKGILSVRETAIAGSQDYNKVYSFPNPVREDFAGNVTITGLVKDSHVKVTDVSGNLVFETMSEGGQATWDLTTYNGRRVATGVYLVFSASNDGSKACMTKILVIGK